ncbi:MAG: type III-B CRISPR module-associated Cmr3 family protein [Fusobacterium sp. JB019]|nr:type III-B CRISPR module-associated Cmr3 family protein [Fusobacterium sp. JB019]
MKYLVRLKPLDSFFFSGKNTFRFRNGEKRKEANHYIESEYYPQQTTLLGVIRKELLIKKGWFRENRNDYAKDIRDKKLNSSKLYSLVGKGSFNAKGKNDFGVIKNISPLFLYNDGKLYKENSLKEQLGKKKYDNFKDKNIKFKVSDKTARVYLGNQKKEGTFLLEEYDQKEEGVKEVVSIKNSGEKIKLSTIFKDDLRVGIDVNKKEAFYKQKFLRLEKNWEFSFILDLSEEIFDSNYENIVYIGAESKPFKMSIEKTEESLNDFLPDKGEIELLSDSIIKQEDYNTIVENSYFILGEFKYFKNFRVEDGKYQKSNPMLILKKGSIIFYKKDKSKIIKEKLENKEYKKIGYNYIIGGEE